MMTNQRPHNNPSEAGHDMMSPACLGSSSKGQSRPRHKAQLTGCGGNQPEILNVNICFVVVTTQMSEYLCVYLFMDYGSLSDKVQRINWCCSEQSWKFINYYWIILDTLHHLPSIQQKQISHSRWSPCQYFWPSLGACCIHTRDQQ